MPVVEKRIKGERKRRQELQKVRLQEIVDKKQHRVVNFSDAEKQRVKAGKKTMTLQPLEKEWTLYQVLKADELMLLVTDKRRLKVPDDLTGEIARAEAGASRTAVMIRDLKRERGLELPAEMQLYTFELIGEL